MVGLKGVNKMPDKLTDKEIVKALECCGNQMYSCTDKKCKAKTLGDALDLINRLQAENVRLKAERDKEHDYSNHYARMYVKAKAEAYKGCIGKLKGIANAEQIVSIDGEWAISQRMADNLLKEMVGEDNG